MRSATRLAALAAIGLCVAACRLDPEDAVCPFVEAGDLVITELRGPQDGSDSYGQWIEVFNATDRDLDLYGLRLEMQPDDGDDPAIVLLRREEVALLAGAYVVLGRFPDDRLPEHVDYGWGDAVDVSQGARLNLAACGEIVDTMIYRDLPGVGSWSLDGAIAPSAKANDDEDAFCNDAEPPPTGGEQTEIGVPGTPGEENRPCE